MESQTSASPAASTRPWGVFTLIGAAALCVAVSVSPLPEFLASELSGAPAPASAAQQPRAVTARLDAQVDFDRVGVVAAAAAAAAEKKETAPAADTVESAPAEAAPAKKKPAATPSPAPTAAAALLEDSLLFPLPESAAAAGPNQNAAGLGSVGKGKLFSAPLAPLAQSSPFGQRTNPLTGQPGEHHTGQDFSASCGTSVKAAAAGTVSFSGWHEWGGGNRVVVDHGYGIQTTYNHLSVLSVSVGDRVQRGGEVAQVGSTGNSTGCHLHFELVVEGQTVDPAPWH